MHRPVKRVRWSTSPELPRPRGGVGSCPSVASETLGPPHRQHTGLGEEPMCPRGQSPVLHLLIRPVTPGLRSPGGRCRRSGQGGARPASFLALGPDLTSWVGPGHTWLPERDAGRVRTLEPGGVRGCVCPPQPRPRAGRANGPAEVGAQTRAAGGRAAQAVLGRRLGSLMRLFLVSCFRTRLLLATIEKATK